MSGTGAHDVKKTNMKASLRITHGGVDEKGSVFIEDNHFT
jgi:hypothetical protein